MNKKSGHPDIYKIQKELFLEDVEKLTINVVGAFENDHGSTVSSWGEVPMYVLASLLVKSLYYLIKPECSSQEDPFWIDLYPETKNILISLANGINYKLGVCYQTKEIQEELLSKLDSHSESFEKIQEEIFINDGASMLFKKYKLNHCSDDDLIKETKEMLRSFINHTKEH